ncbi:MAG: DUF401 family protein [Nitrospiraceae bacterium]|nr:DUF401 family protein [Nitrospiraceae bacterium]
MPDLLKISLILLLILFLLRKKLPIGAVMLIASAGLAALYAMPLSSLVAAARRAVGSDVSIKLLLALSLIRIFELILREKEVLAAMMAAVKGSFRNRKVVIISMPLLIGMLPSLGGAYFSAPMVKEATTGLKMPPEEKAFINYWYRHPWEYILPLYPGILLAAAVSGVPLYHLITANIAYALVLLATGFLYSMRGVANRPQHAEAPQARWRDGVNFLPVLAILVSVGLLHIELHYALLVIIAVLLAAFRYSPKAIPRLLRYGFTLEVITLIAGIMFFKEIMETSGAVRNLTAYFVSHGIPVIPIVCLLPFLAGLLTGHTVGFVGSTFPLIMNVAGNGLPVISLAFAAGFIGVLISPVHLCLVLTREYFKADMTGVYQRIVPASAIIFAVAVAEYLVMR